jgi:excisionase family DNA binding protein
VVFIVKTEKSEYLSLAEVAKILGISRIAVYKKVKKGEIKAIRIGRSFAVPKGYLSSILGRTLREDEKEEIKAAVDRTVKEYGEVLKKLGSQ